MIGVDAKFQNTISSMIGSALSDVKRMHPEYHMNSRSFGSIGKRLSGMLIGNTLNSIRKEMKSDNVYNALRQELNISKCRQKTLKKSLNYWMDRCKELEGSEGLDELSRTSD